MATINKSKLTVILVALIVVFCLIMQTPANPKEKPLPPNIIPVIFVKGTNYEMGYQYGYQVAERIKVTMDERWVSAYKLLGDHDKILKWLQAFQYYVKKWTPEIINELIGMAEGATDAGYPMSYIDTLLIQTGPWFRFGLSPTATIPSPLEPLPPKEYKYNPPPRYEPGKRHGTSIHNEILETETAHGCSRWAAWGKATKDGKLVCGNSFDGGLGKQLNYIAFPDRGYPFIACSYWFGEIIRHPAMNTEGLWVSGGALPPPRDIDKNFGLIPPFGLRHLIQFYDNAEKAKDVVINKWRFTGGRVHNWLIADSNNNGYIFELTAALNTCRKAGDFGEKDWLAAANTFVIQENAALNNPPSDPFHRDPRIIMEWAFFDKYVGDIDLEFGKMLYRWHDPIGQFKGIGHRSNTSVHVGEPRTDDSGIMLSCTGTAGKNIIVGDGRRNMDTWYAFYTMPLKNDPTSVVHTSRWYAEEASKKADTAMRKLKVGFGTISDYLALKKMFIDVSKVLYGGNNYLTDAQLTTGNESLYLLSKAITAYTKAELMFNAISNLINPPPEKPGDLGLEPIKMPLVSPYQWPKK